MTHRIFTPVGTTKNLTASGTTSNVALPVISTYGSRSVRVYNATDVVVFIEFGASAVEAAVATSLPLGPGATEWFEIGQGVTHMAAITAAGGGLVYATEGQGS